MEPLFNEGGSLHFLPEKTAWARYYYGIMEGNKDYPGRSLELSKSRRRTGKQFHSQKKIKGISVETYPQL